MDSWTDGFALAALATLGVLGFGRAIALGAKGVSVVPIDRERRPHEMLADIAFLLSGLLWIYEVVAFAWPLDLQPARGALSAVILDSTTTRLLGTAAMLAGLLVYGLALQALGPSWRLTIDREKADKLVTHGIFARTRNPIYLGFTLLAVGSFLLLGRLILLLLALVFVVYFRHLIAREERFLGGHYGERYLEYCKRVGPYWTFG